MENANGNEAVHPLIAKIRARSAKLEEVMSKLDRDEISCEKAITYARISDAESRFQMTILKEAVFDAKHHPNKPKPCFSDQ
jgi:hypothetical protein